MDYTEALKVVTARLATTIAECTTALRDGDPEDVDMQATRYEREGAQAALDYLNTELGEQARLAQLHVQPLTRFDTPRTQLLLDKVI
jgi:hypothetical protein